MYYIASRQAGPRGDAPSASIMIIIMIIIIIIIYNICHNSSIII